ncbi:MAG: dihydrodipicolinate synthase family protein [Acidobacteriota bacterium]|nr:dihydrodipicolinate synthase family protein [Acidobacteriota bacterium]
MVDVSGVFPALTTPFGTDGAVSLGDIKHNIARYNQTELAGYVVLGSTGESVLIQSKETDSILSTVKETAAPGKKLIAGTGAESTAETIERTRRAAALGYHVALVKTPYYYKPAYKPEVLIAHYRRVADESPIPVLLYSVPIFTGLALEAPETIALAAHPNIIGIKDSSGNIHRISEMIAGAPSDFQVLVGAAATVFPCLAIGARGAILALASALPEKCASLYQLYKEGHLNQARELQKLLLGASNLIVSRFGIAGVKYAMDYRGYRGGHPRLPLQPLSQEHKSKISSFLTTLEQPIMVSA